MSDRLTFDEACAYLFPRTSGPKGDAWSLAPTRAMLAALGNPERELPLIHIGGTNGKGSVVAMLAAVMAEAGARVGTFTSPHLIDVRERFQVNGQPISKDAFAMWVNTLRPVIEETGASFFEVTTAIALADFRARNVDIGVVEVGLGGRLDSTNVIEPLVAGVTNVALDHTEYLGPSLTDIAREKAGISKAGVPMILGEQDESVLDVLVAEATRLGATPRVVGPGEYAGNVSLSGRHQRRNALFAERVLEQLPDALRPSPDEVQRGLTRAFLPARFQRLGKWVIDVAHNEAGMVELVENIRLHQLPEPVHAVFGALDDKPGAAMLTRLETVVDRLIVTAPPGRSPDRDAWSGDGRLPWVWEPDFDQALRRAEEGAGTVVVTGSFYTAGAAMVRLPGFAGAG